jgi:hypothetical protein
MRWSLFANTNQNNAFRMALVGFVTAYVSLGDAISIFAGISYGLMFLTALLLKETNGKVLSA